MNDINSTTVIVELGTTAAEAVTPVVDMEAVELLVRQSKLTDFAKQAARILLRSASTLDEVKQRISHYERATKRIGAHGR